MKKQTITIGGNRLGSGQKMKTKINAYNRSTHNLSTKIATSMAPGVLYPIACIPAMRGDSFDFKLGADARTIPTKGALFGSYKLQVDVFQCPVRLYQAILHNNPLAIGLKMNQVLFPQLTIETPYKRGLDYESGKIANTALIKYLGLSGLGSHNNEGMGGVHGRTINAIPALAYYDIYKTYYANKQEEKGYIIGTSEEDDLDSIINNIWYAQETEHHSNWGNVDDSDNILIKPTDIYSNVLNFNITGEDLSLTNVQLTLVIADDEQYSDTLKTLMDEGKVTAYVNEDASYISGTVVLPDIETASNDTYVRFDEANGLVTKTIQIKEFDLSNIDDMRYALLSHHTLGTPYNVNNFNKLPYKEVYGKTEETEQALQKYPMAGLALKTYQNDIYNNWLNTDWLEGENSISEISAVEVVDGKFSMDSLNFAQKLYNMLNRIVVAGNTYEDWQDVVYEEVKRRQIESPIFCGGMSREIMFDEVLQTTPTEESALGTIGGRGRFAEDSQKGGKLHIKCDEACFIIVMASLTPRVFYTQGNEFWLTDLFSMDDLHKPALDGIGFQDLIGERMNWQDTFLDVNASTPVYRNKVGKLPAWIEYMTNVDRAYGDFAEGDRAYMILNRNYGTDDYTTYVDPAKYNYAFADASLTAQNFWLLFNIDIKARRLMSARIIPNV